MRCLLPEWVPFELYSNCTVISFSLHCRLRVASLHTQAAESQSGLPTHTVQNLKMCLVTRGSCTAGRQYHSGFQSINCRLGQWLPSTSTARVAADGTRFLLLSTLVLHASRKQLYQLTVYPETHTPPTVQCPSV